LAAFWASAPEDVRQQLVAQARGADDDAPDPDQQDDDDAPDPDGSPRQLSRPLKTLLIIAAALAVVIAVWAIGRPPATQPTATQSVSTDQSARAAELELALAADPTNTEIMLELGVAYFNSGEFEQAAAHWNRVVELDPSSVLAWYNLGFYHLASSPPDVEQAKAAWQKVIELDPDSDWSQSAANHLTALESSLASESASPSPSASAEDP
jgi:tetratricopeptide (TPR) repeat protein